MSYKHVCTCLIWITGEIEVIGASVLWARERMHHKCLILSMSRGSGARVKMEWIPSKYLHGLRPCQGTYGSQVPEDADIGTGTNHLASSLSISPLDYQYR